MKTFALGVIILTQKWFTLIHSAIDLHKTFIENSGDIALCCQIFWDTAYKKPPEFTLEEAAANSTGL